ncbi:MAG: hypothetical protein AB1297_06325 [bacterium]
MKKAPLVILFFVFLIGFWIWFQRVIKTQREIPVKKEVIEEIKRRIEEIDKIARNSENPEKAIKESKKAIFQLTFIGSPGASYLITSSLDKKRHRFARVIYLQILAAIESKKAISCFALILKNEPDYLLRMQSAISLSMIKDERVILPLKEGLFDKEMVVKVASATGLIKMGRKDLVDKASKNDLSLKMYLEKWQQGF